MPLGNIAPSEYALRSVSSTTCKVKIQSDTNSDPGPPFLSASEVHRNTISNFETGKYGGSDEGVSAMRAALEDAGIIFVDENGEGAGVRVRKSKK